MQQNDEARQLARIRDELLSEFGADVTARVVEEQLTALVATFDGAPVRAFVPVLAQRAARERLRELSRI